MRSSEIANPASRSKLPEVEGHWFPVKFGRDEGGGVVGDLTDGQHRLRLRFRSTAGGGGKLPGSEAAVLKTPPRRAGGGTETGEKSRGGTPARGGRASSSKTGLREDRRKGEGKSSPLKR